LIRLKPAALGFQSRGCGRLRALAALARLLAEKYFFPGEAGQKIDLSFFAIAMANLSEADWG